MKNDKLFKRFQQLLKDMTMAAKPPAPAGGGADDGDGDVNTPGSEDHENAEMGHINALSEMHKALSEHAKAHPPEHPIHALVQKLGQHVASLHQMNGAQFPSDNQEFAEPDGGGAHADVHMAASDMKEVEKRIAKRTADLQKRLEEAEARAKAAEDLAKSESGIRELAETKEELRKFAHLPLDIDKEAAKFVTLRKSDKASYDFMMQQLTAANEQAKLAKSLEATVGSGVPGGTRPSAWTEIEKKAGELVAKSTDSKLTKAQAINRVMDDPENFALVRRYYDEGGERVIA